MMGVELISPGADRLRVAIRCDASQEIGLGHTMRCLTLADALHAHGARCSFLTRSLPGNINAHINNCGHSVEVLNAAPSQALPIDPGGGHYNQWLGVSVMEDAEDSRALIERMAPDLVIVDHYALDRTWHERAAGDVPVMSIDDLADREHGSAILLDQNFGRRREDYDGLVRPDASLLIGPTYALLRPEFAKERSASIARRRARPELRQLVISMGGADSVNSTSRILEVLAKSDLPEKLRLVVIMGRAAPSLNLVSQLAEKLPLQTRVVTDVVDMASLLRDTDLAIGAAGGSVWERCCLGVPSLLLNIADNQRHAALALDEAGVGVCLGDFDSVGWEARLRAALKRYVNPEVLTAMSEKASSLVDGQGAIRVANEIFEMLSDGGAA